MRTSEELIQHINKLLRKFPKLENAWKDDGRYSWTTEPTKYEALMVEITNLINHLYERDHPVYEKTLNLTKGRGNPSAFLKLKGVLQGVRENIKRGFIDGIVGQITVDIKADFLESANELLQQQHKDSAAVLGCAVLEDSLKRLAEKHQFPELRNQEMGVVVNRLYAEKVIPKSTCATIMSFKNLRNAALHAQWHEVSVESVSTLLSFLPVFLEQYKA